MAASFRIFNDHENRKEPQSNKLLNKDIENLTKRTVLGAVNFNVKDGKPSSQVENVPKKTFLGGRQQLSKSSQLRNDRPPNFFISAKEGKCSDMAIYRDEDTTDETSASATAKTAILLKAENKLRVLKDKCQLSTAAYEEKEENIRYETLPDNVSAVLNSLPLYEPMSEVEDSVVSTDSMDISMASVKGDRVSEPVRVSEPLTFRDIYICEEYRTDISIYLRNLQLQNRPKKNYMARQADISHSMRAILVDWLVEVTEEYNMTTETLFLAVNYIDRFLSQMSCVRAKLQLVGTAAMFVASKYEEIYPPDVKDFVYITDDTYTKAQVLRMEHLILRVLCFNLSVPTTLWFLTDFLCHHRVSDTVKYLAMYLCELTLLEADPYLGFLPSDVAVSAVCVARYTVFYPSEEIFPTNLQKVTDCHLSDIVHVIAAIDRTFRNADASPQQAIREKYKGDKYHGVAMINPLNEDCHVVIAREYNVKLK